MISLKNILKDLCVKKFYTTMLSEGMSLLHYEVSTDWNKLGKARKQKEKAEQAGHALDGILCCMGVSPGGQSIWDSFPQFLSLP